MKGSGRGPGGEGEALSPPSIEELPDGEGCEQRESDDGQEHAIRHGCGCRWSTARDEGGRMEDWIDGFASGQGAHLNRQDRVWASARITEAPEGKEESARVD